VSLKIVVVSIFAVLIICRLVIHSLSLSVFAIRGFDYVRTTKMKQLGKIIHFNSFLKSYDVYQGIIAFKYLKITDTNFNHQVCLHFLKR